MVTSGKNQKSESLLLFPRAAPLTMKIILRRPYLITKSPRKSFIFSRDDNNMIKC